MSTYLVARLRNGPAAGAYVLRRLVVVSASLSSCSLNCKSKRKREDEKKKRHHNIIVIVNKCCVTYIMRVNKCSAVTSRNQRMASNGAAGIHPSPLCVLLRIALFSTSLSNDDEL